MRGFVAGIVLVLAIISSITGCASAPPAKSSEQWVRIESIPSGARLFIDGIYKGLTPQVLSLQKATHKIEIMKDGYADMETYISPRPRSVLIHIITLGLAFYAPDTLESEYVFRLAPL